MYICLKNTENTENIINTFIENNINVDVSRYEVTSYIDCELKEYGYISYVSVLGKKVVIHSGLQTLIEISFDELISIYDLN